MFDPSGTLTKMLTMHHTNEKMHAHHIMHSSHLVFCRRRREFFNFLIFFLTMQGGMSPQVPGCHRCSGLSNGCLQWPACSVTREGSRSWQHHTNVMTHRWRLFISGGAIPYQQHKVTSTTRQQQGQEEVHESKQLPQIPAR